MSRFIQGSGNWVDYRRLGRVLEVDFHLGKRDPELMYWDAMADARDTTLLSLQRGLAEGFEFVMFRHGWSTSHLGKTTARSVVRSVMRSPAATPFIDRSRSIQHDSVFVAALKRNAATGK